MITRQLLRIHNRKEQVQKQKTDCVAIASSGPEIMPDHLEAVVMIEKIDYNEF